MVPMQKPPRARRASMPPRLRLRLLAPVLATVVLGAIAGAAPAFAAPVQQGTIVTCKPNFETPPTTSAPASRELTSILSVLRRPRTHADQLAPDAFAFISGFGVSLDGIRLAGVGTDGRSRFVVPALGDRFANESCTPTLGKASGKRHARHVRRKGHVRNVRRASSVDRAGEPVVCLVDAGRSGACVSASGLAAHGLFAIDGDGGSHVTGLVPDGVVGVILTSGETSSTVAVADNFFAFALERGVKESGTLRIQWRMTDGSVRQPSYR